MGVKFKRIGNYRTDSDHNQDDIANLLNTCRSTYSQWEYGINNFPLDKLIIFADYYNISIDYLVELNDKKEIKKCLSGNVDKLPKKLKLIRKENGDNQKLLSKILDIPQTTYSNYETGKVEIPLPILVNYCKYYNISIDYMLNRKEDKEIMK